MVHFDVIFMFSAFGNSDDEHNDMQIKYSYPDQEIPLHEIKSAVPYVRLFKVDCMSFLHICLILLMWFI